jgi:predicted metal-dependent hydrolase
VIQIAAYDYNLTRSNRKTITLRVTQDGTLDVRAPLRTSARDIDNFVASKQNWIAKCRKTIADAKQAYAPPPIGWNSPLLWRGKEHPIQSDGESCRMWFDGEIFHFPSCNLENLKYNIPRLLKNCAAVHLRERVAYFADIMHAKPVGMTVGDACKRWGSCSSDKRITFSWRLCLAADDLIDSVVVHELAHLFEMNHSPRFYAIVRATMPDYDARSAKLKDFARQITDIYWEL